MKRLFRAWDKKNNEWYGESHTQMLTFKDFSIFGECTMLCPPSPIHLQHLIITQYIGIEDVNGVKLYEGDICKGQYAGGNKSDYLNKIVWDDETCGFSFANSPIWTWERLEKTGTIFENKNLLNEKT